MTMYNYSYLSMPTKPQLNPHKYLEVIMQKLLLDASVVIIGKCSSMQRPFWIATVQNSLLSAAKVVFFKQAKFSPDIIFHCHPPTKSDYHI